MKEKKTNELAIGGSVRYLILENISRCFKYIFGIFSRDLNRHEFVIIFFFFFSLISRMESIKIIYFSQLFSITSLCACGISSVTNTSAKKIRRNHVKFVKIYEVT